MYRGHPDYAGEAGHAALIRHLAGYDGWALSTSAEALPGMLALCPPGVRVAAWHRGERPTASRWPLLAEAVKRLAVVAARDTPIHLAFAPDQVELTAGSADEADGTDAVGCELDGDPLTVAFHPSRLLDALTATGSGRARIALTGPAKAALITPAGDDDGQGDGAEPIYGTCSCPSAPPGNRHHPHPPLHERHPRSLSVKRLRRIEGGFAGDPRRWPRRRGCGS